MALVVSGEGRDLFGVLECDEGGCRCHVALRPVDVQTSGYELDCAVFDTAYDEGWWLDGSSWCPAHWPEDRPGRPTTVADGFAWVSLTREGVKGAKRRSEPLTPGSARPRH